MYISKLSSLAKDFERLFDQDDQDELQAALALVNNEKRVYLKDKYIAPEESKETLDLPRIVAVLGLVLFSASFIVAAINSGNTIFFVHATIAGIMAGLTLWSCSLKRISRASDPEGTQDPYEYLSESILDEEDPYTVFDLHGNEFTIEEIWSWCKDFKEVDSLRRELLDKNPSLIWAHVVLMSALRKSLIFKALQDSSASIAKE